MPPLTADKSRPQDTADADENVDFSGLADYVGLRLRIVQLQFYEHFYSTGAFEGLSPSAVTLIFAIGANPGVRPGQLARGLKIRRSNLSKLVGALEGDGLISRRESPSDKRTFRLYLTDKGTALSKKLERAMHEHERAATAGLSEPERLVLLGLLGKLSGHLRAELSEAEENGED
jgi:DNA-binding MarR family transcriptional regulator